MFGDVQHTIRDAQYREALININQSPPELEIPKPTTIELETYAQNITVTLETLLDSPIGVYYLKKYLDNFLNITIIVDFLIQYEKVKNLEEVTEIELKDLVFLADYLPSPYKADVAIINQQLRVMEEGDEFEGLEPRDVVENDNSTPVATEANKTNFLTAASAKVLTNLRMGKGIMQDGVRVISFGGNGTRSDRESKRGESNLLGTDDNDKSPSVVGFDEIDIDIESDGTIDDDLIPENRDLLRQSVMDAKDVLLKLMEKLGEKLENKAHELFRAFKESKEYEDMLGSWYFAEKSPLPTDFIKFRMLGRGAFGAVSGVKHKYTGQLVAMKMMNKRLVKGKRALPLVHAEKAVLQILGDNPSSFTVWLKYAFQDADFYYMAIPLCTGGDLLYHLEKNGAFSIERIRFYAAEIFEGIAHLHSLEIIYRDMKPENIILDSSGHCRISDMGLAVVTKNGQRIKMKAGTPGYWAPEVLVKLFYSYPVDIWSLGVVIFQMAIGRCPFSRANTGMDRDKATRYWPIKFPEYCGNRKERTLFPDDLKSLLKGMLRRRASKRFTEEMIRAHPFFSGFDWEDLRNRKIEPPFVPTEKKINAGAAQYLEERGNEREFKQIALTAQDNIPDFDYISKYAHELDIVNALLLKKSRPDLIPIDRRRKLQSNKSRRTTTIGLMKTVSTRVLGSSRAASRGDCVLM